MRMAIAGGTGWIGRLVVGAARGQGHEPVVIARSTGVDLTTGSGLDDALAGADVVIDVTNRNRQSRAFFETATGHLLRAGEKAGVRHHVALSIVGIDKVHLGYYQGKLRQEEVVLAGAVPATVLRATQFHEFPAQMLGRAIGPFVPVPTMKSQPVAAAEVAEALVRIAAGAPQGRAADLAGPDVLFMAPMVRKVIKVRGLRRTVLPLPIPGAVGRAIADGGLLPDGPGPRGTQTFDEWLATPAAQS